MQASPARLALATPTPALQCYPVDCTKLVTNCAACFRLTCTACRPGFELRNSQVRALLLLRPGGREADNRSDATDLRSPPATRSACEPR